MCRREEVGFLPGFLSARIVAGLEAISTIIDPCTDIQSFPSLFTIAAEIIGGCVDGCTVG
jgi:hypothetical protein